MNYFNKIIYLFVFILFTYGVNSLAYSYTITNKTGRDIRVRLYWGINSKLNDKFKLIKNNKKYKFSFPFGNIKAGLCLSKIMVQTKDFSAENWEEARVVEFLKKGDPYKGEYQPKLYSKKPKSEKTCRDRSYTIREAVLMDNHYWETLWYWVRNDAATTSRESYEKFLEPSFSIGLGSRAFEVEKKGSYKIIPLEGKVYPNLNPYKEDWHKVLYTGRIVK